MRSPRWLYLAFTLSGAAGLAYEVVWTRYLGLYVGHSAYAQVLVIAVYLGGMGLGALSVGRFSKRIASPLAWYAGAELLLALAGLLFHMAFRLVSEVSYDTLFPALSDPTWVAVVRWGLAGALILPQAAILGATFPLMAAGLVRREQSRPGRGVALAYLANSLGGAVGVLLAGFWLIGAFGLPGTLVAAAFLNIAAAAMAWTTASALEREAGTTASALEREAGTTASALEREAGSTASALAREAGTTASAPEPDVEATPAAPHPALSDSARQLSAWAPPHPLTRTLLAVSFGTALASFIYEIGWIRMLSLVLGSATHAFELMLSAFILGLAIGAWFIQSRADRTSDPIRLIGIVQVTMGAAALATLPLYMASFGVMELLVEVLPGRAGGYAAFNLGRYALCLAVMLPSTIMAGMTLPLITGSLLRMGRGEETIGQVYGVNTLGSVVGAGVAGLLLLPVLGLKGLLMTGAALDMALGIGLLYLASRARPAVRRLTLGATLAGTASLAVVGLAVQLDQSVLVGGVFRGGGPRTDDAWEVLYYRDGRTATVSAQRSEEFEMINLSTNGKPDASVEFRWFAEGRDTLLVQPHAEVTDFTTQVLAPLIALAHVPSASTAANIGHGSGMSGSALLASHALQELTTIEIEPLMVEGSRVFQPLNQSVFSDPRSRFAFDDAKSFFSSSQDRFDVIFAEPSNPWVSGVSNLFSIEFYQHISHRLTPTGVFGQWIQVYELDDPLFLSILAALDAVFPSYRGYLVATADVAIVASTAPTLSDADWSVLDLEGVRQIMDGAPPFTADHLNGLLLFDETTLRGVLDAGVSANSDYRPILDLGSERARFLDASSEGLLSLARSRFDLLKNLAGTQVLPQPYTPPPALGLAPLVNASRAAWARETVDDPAALPNEFFPESSTSVAQLRDFLHGVRGTGTPESWLHFTNAFVRAEAVLHWGTTGWADEPFFADVYAFLERADAPVETRAAVDLMNGVDTWDWALAASAADLLLATVDGGRGWVEVHLLLDASVTAYLKTGRPAAARNALDRLVPYTERKEGDLRNQLLEALVAGASPASG